jgi:hypothetical protein
MADSSFTGYLAHIARRLTAGPSSDNTLSTAGSNSFNIIRSTRQIHAIGLARLISARGGTDRLTILKLAAQN